MICSRLQSRVARDLRFEDVTSKLLHDAVNHHMRFFSFEESLWATPYHLMRQRSIDRRPSTDVHQYLRTASIFRVMTEAVFTSETSVYSETSQRYIPENSHPAYYVLYQEKTATD
jgi:hypothetical protein